MSAGALLLCTIAGGLATVGEATAADVPSAAASPANSVQRKTDELLAAPMGEFQYARKGNVWWQYLDWSSDGCSNAPDKPYGYDFLPSCQRHDFGYRNYKKQHRFTEANRKKLDLELGKDMLNVCQKYGSVRRAHCESTAAYYYNVVRKAGS